MKLNIEVIIPIVFLIIISWVGNLYIFNTASLNKPLLLKSYYSSLLSDGYNLQLFYISNIYDKEAIVSASFPDLGNTPFPASSTSMGNIGSNYRINKIDINLSTIFLDNGKLLIETDIAENIYLKKIQLTTGYTKKTYEYDLGEICLFKRQLVDNDSLIIDYSMSSNNNSGRTTLIATDDIQITEVVNPLNALLSEVCDIDINGKPMSSTTVPFTVKSGDEIEVEYHFKNKSKIKPQFKSSNFFFTLVFRGIDSEGNPVVRNVFIDAYNQNDIKTKDIRGLIKESR